MWALLQSLLELSHSARRSTKLGLSLFVWDLLCLVVIMMVTSAITKEVMHPAISIIGTLWVLATAAAIWHLGGVAVDSGFLARILNMEMGKEFTRAFNVFFILGSATVIFFFLFPVWKFWAGTIILPVLLVGIFACANMAKRETNWTLFFWIYASIAGVILLAIVLAGLTGWTTQNGLAVIHRPWFQSWIERLLLLGLLFLAISFMPKTPKEMLRFGAGLAILISAILLVFPEIQPNFNLDKTPKMPERKSQATVSAAIASQPLVATGITLRPGEVILGTKDASAPPIELIVRFPNGEAVDISKTWWTADNKIRLTHVGKNVKGRPGEILYRGEAGKYQFEKESSASVRQMHITPRASPMSATYYPPPERQTQQVSNKKEDCPFD